MECTGPIGSRCSMLVTPRIAQAVATRMIKLQLELGGKDPSYVRADADVKAAAESLADGAPIEPAAVHVPSLGLKISALARNGPAVYVPSSPPAANTDPSGNSVAVWCTRAAASDPVVVKSSESGS
jgi:hypothetical protein